jgi:hypothetical protein
MTGYFLAALFALAMLLLVTVESWYALARESLTLIAVYAVVAGIAVAGLWWLGWI